MIAETDEGRILSADPRADERELENTVRPRRMKEYLGQRQVKERIEISVAAAVRREEAMDHTLLYGPPGLGKTTLAQVIARELGVGLRHTSGPVLERPGDLAALLTNLKARDVLFIDEVHRLNPVVQELLYPAMEDFRLDIVIGEGPAAHTMRLKLKPFTLVGATTRAGLLSSPLRDRFGIQERLELYSKDELRRIVLRAAQIIGISCTPNGAAEIAARARGTPRVANRLLRRARDFAEVRAEGSVNRSAAVAAMELYNVHDNGLDRMDRRLLGVLIERFGGGPAGVEALAAGIGEDRGTIEDVYEPFLVRAGFVLRTPRGRVAGPAAYAALGLTRPGRQGDNPQLEGLDNGGEMHAEGETRK